MIASLRSFCRPSSIARQPGYFQGFDAWPSGTVSIRGLKPTLNNRSSAPAPPTNITRQVARSNDTQATCEPRGARTSQHLHVRGCGGTRPRMRVSIMQSWTRSRCARSSSLRDGCGRHRPAVGDHPNVLILGRSPIAMQSGKLSRPGVETEPADETMVARVSLLECFEDRLLRDLAGDETMLPYHSEDDDFRRRERAASRRRSVPSQENDQHGRSAASRKILASLERPAQSDL